MSSMRCPQCGLVNWLTAETCKRCKAPINGAEPPTSGADSSVYGAADSIANGWEPHMNSAGTPPEANSWHEASNSYDASNSYEGEPVYQWGDHAGYRGSSYQYVGSSGAAQKTGLAIASMVVGIISMIACGLLGVGSVTGLVLGIVALVKAKNHPLEYGGQGFAIAGVCLSVVSFLFTAVVMSIAIPNLMASYRAANEGSAISCLKTIANAESVYVSSTGEGKYGTLKELAAAGLIDQTLARGVKNNYVFEIKTNGSSFEAFATPLKDSDFKGRSFYLSSQEQFIRGAKKGGVAATAYDPPLNQDSAPGYRRTYEREPEPPSYRPAYQN